MKRAGAAMGTHAKSNRSRAATMVGFSSWIHRNCSDAHTPMRKEVSAHRSSARTVSGREAAAADEREAEKKKATSAASSAAHMVKKAPWRSWSASRRYAAARPMARTAKTGSPPRSRRKAAAGTSAAARRALWANAGPEAEAAPAAAPRGPAPPKEERGRLAEEEAGKGTSGFGEDVELRRSWWWWCGAGDAAGEGDGERVEKVGVESDGEMRRRPWRDADPELGSMPAAAGSRVLHRGLGFGTHRPAGEEEDDDGDGVEEEIWSGRVGVGRQGRGGNGKRHDSRVRRDEARWLTVGHRVRAGGCVSG